MHQDAVEFLASPCCFKSLEISGVARRDQHGDIQSGGLSCACGKSYPITRGVAELLLPGALADKFLEENRKTWSFIWDKGAGFGGHFASEAMFEDDFNLEPAVYKDAVMLELGIGRGKYLPYLLKRGPARVFGLDIADSIFDSYERLACWFSHPGTLLALALAV